MLVWVSLRVDVTVWDRVCFYLGIGEVERQGRQDANEVLSEVWHASRVAK